MELLVLGLAVCAVTVPLGVIALVVYLVTRKREQPPAHQVEDLEPWDRRPGKT